MKYAKDTESMAEVFEKLGNPNLKRNEDDAAFGKISINDIK